MTTYLPWMAQYLVRRADIEPNLHTLYMAFIGYLTDMHLDELVLQETYSQIRDILLADHAIFHWAHFDEPWPLIGLDCRLLLKTKVFLRRRSL